MSGMDFFAIWEFFETLLFAIVLLGFLLGTFVIGVFKVIDRIVRIMRSIRRK
jgi:hypothetical protein